MEIVKLNILKILLLICLIITSVLILIYDTKKVDYNFLQGKWVGNYEDSRLTIEIKKNKCNLEIKNSDLIIPQNIWGDCYVDMIKAPHRFVIKNISQMNYSLYSIILPINKKLIQITKLSTKWKLQPVSFTKENTIFLKKL